MAKAGEKKVRLTPASEFKELFIELSEKDRGAPEARYIATVPNNRRQHFAQFFTPPRIATLMATWVSTITPERILEPSVGTGILVRAIGEKITSANVTCIDVDQAPLDVATRTAPKHLDCNFVQRDFLLGNIKELFDGVLSNPPYLRHHDISYEVDIYEEIGKRNKVVISKACNIYVLFIFEILRVLAPGGRAAILVPTDWLSSNAAKCLRDHLLKTKMLKEMLCFDENDNQFNDAITTSVVLLIEKSQFKNDPLLLRFYSDKFDAPFIKVIDWQTLEFAKKWSGILVNEVIDGSNFLLSLSEIATTKRGLATGANQFFHLTERQVDEASISYSNVLPCIGAAKDVLGLIFTKEDLARLDLAGAATKLVNFSGKLSEAELKYIKQGEERGYHKRFLLARRNPWFKNEQREVAQIWAASFARNHVKFIWNQSGALNLTTYHCIYTKNLSEFQIGALVCLLNSSPIQRRFAEHLRVLGGGLLKFQPNDLLEIQIPDVRLLSNQQLFDLNSFLSVINGQLWALPSSQISNCSVVSDLDNYVEALLKLDFASIEAAEGVLDDQMELF